MRVYWIPWLLAIVPAGFACGKPRIEQQCTMNGLGEGKCAFTNTGDGEGAMCGVVRVFRKDGSREIVSNTICSGKLAESSTINIEFSMPETREFCDGSTGQSWNAICSFAFGSRDSMTFWFDEVSKATAASGTDRPKAMGPIEPVSTDFHVEPERKIYQ